jgi:alanyl-tRNA synthetase
MREHDRLLGEIAATLRVATADAPEAVRRRERERRSLEKAARDASGALAAGEQTDLGELGDRALDIAGATVLVSEVQSADSKALLDLIDRLKGRLDDAAIVLGTAVDGRVHLAVSVAPALVERGVKAGEVVKLAAEVVGGGGGGRDTLAQAGGRDPEKLPEALERAREAIESTLAG